MKIEELKSHLDGRFDKLESRIDDLERYRAYVRGVYRTLSVIGGVGVVVLTLLIKFNPK